MLTQEDLQAISQLIKNEVEPIKQDISSMKKDISDLKSDVAEMKEDIAAIKEDGEITRENTNEIGKWIDYYFNDNMPFPVSDELDDEIQSILKQKK
ncbi:MAG: hypothetical protein HDT47_04050 [Ruminococcaceae bacterium]|nr:hypothetical protein [Oscillospiraceae bacterium]